MDGTIAQQQQSFDRIRYPQSGFIMNPLDLSSLSYYDSSADFSGESAPSRGSPISPVFGNSYQLPLESEWPAYLDKPSMSPDMDVFFGESFGSPTAFPASQNPGITSSSPNPLDVMDETVSFGRDDLNDAPLFQDIGEPVLNATASAAMQGHQQQQQQQQQQQARTAQPAASTPKMQTRSQQRVAQRVPARSSDLKRKTSSCDSASSRSASPEPPARRAKHNAASDPSKNPHNLIEKRYRVNINEKIVALRDAVPSLRCALNLQHQHPEGSPNEAAAAAAADETLDVTAEELGGLMPARKLNKATILSKATEYIGHLEKKNDQLAKENGELQKRLAEAQRWQRTQPEGNGYWA